MAAPNKSNVFQFMSLRSPQNVEPKKFRRFYIQDEYITQSDGVNADNNRELREVFSMGSASPVGKVLYENLFCKPSDLSDQEINEQIVQAVLNLVESRTVECNPGVKNSLINDLEKFPYIRPDYAYFLLPSKLENIQSEFNIKKLLDAKKVIMAHCHSFNRKKLLLELKTIFEVTFLSELVFYPKGLYDFKLLQLRDALFDNLYLLYILRRKTEINLEEIISGLQTLHALEFLAVDDYLQGVRSGKLDPSSGEVTSFLNFLQRAFLELSSMDLKAKSNNFHYVKDKQDLINLFQATPIIHPIVAELAYYGKGKFNNIKPYLGDLKVVKQWLCGYKVGEISHIHNIMKGEEKTRDNRYLEKSEEVLSFSSESSQDTQTESQTTDRFELKKETENVIKTDINVGASASVTYDSKPIVANVGANFAYANSNQDTQRSSLNFAREVMNKAVTNIQSRATQQRSITKIYESEEKNNHKFTNTDKDAEHISGIYRWLDKKYKAQVYNYGQRWMFEFVIPEPAAFYVTAKLKAAEFDISAPKKPSPPRYKTVKIIKPGTSDVELTAEAITKDIFDKLRMHYDLSELTYPQAQITIPFSDLQKNNNLTVNVGGAGNRVWINNQYKSKSTEGYNVKSVSIVGNVKFWGKEGNFAGAEASNDNFEDNKWLFMVNGVTVWDERDGSKNDKENHVLDNFIDLTSPINAKNGEVILDISFQDLDWYSIMAYLGLQVDADYLLDQQTKIYRKIFTIEQGKIDKINQELEISYNSQLSDYRNKLDDLSAHTVNDIIQGQSEGFNKRTIADELKKHCISMIAKEFDLYQNDDLLSNKDALGNVDVESKYDAFIAEEVTLTNVDGTVKKDEDGNDITEVITEFRETKKIVKFPKIDIDQAKFKARYVQFIEQAFEWQQIAYIFYPYFWADEKKWINLMSRLNYTDNNMTAFLKAGSSRVLLSVTPGYYNAVMHFLATREPWGGGPLPVIGDPLFIPIYEEIRKQQDDLQNATPDGDEWDFEVPTSLIYLQDSTSPIPADLKCND